VGAAWPLIVLIVAGTAALRNVRRGRGDRRGALRLALCLGALRMMLFFGAHHLASPTETILFIEHLASATLHAGFAYVFYLAVEPYARRLWPRVLVSWVRVLEGRFRDPLVGRDLLVGCATGALAALIGRLGVWLPLALDWPQALPSWSLWTFEPLRGTVPAMVSVAALCSENLLEIIFPITTLLIFRLLLRRNWLAIVAATLMGIVVLFPDSGSIPAYLVRMVLWITPLWLVLFRCGMLGFGATFLVGGLASQLPLTLHPSAWLLGPMLLSLACIVAPALYGFWISMAGRPLFRDEVLDPARR
jgi:serine/threonine-protein kinase